MLSIAQTFPKSEGALNVIGEQAGKVVEPEACFDVRGMF